MVILELKEQLCNRADFGLSRYKVYLPFFKVRASTSLGDPIREC